MFAKEAKLQVHEAPIGKEFLPPKQWTDERSYGTNFNKAFEKALEGIVKSRC